MLGAHFRPFDLPVDESRWIRRRLERAGCRRGPSSFVAVRTVPIESERFGVARRTTFELPNAGLVFGSERGRACSFVLPSNEPP